MDPPQNFILPAFPAATLASNGGDTLLRTGLVSGALEGVYRLEWPRVMAGQGNADLDLENGFFCPLGNQSLAISGNGGLVADR